MTARWLLVLTLAVLPSGLARARTATPLEPAGETKLQASDGAANDDFGVVVSLSGDTALVGAPKHDDNGGDSGSAYVFVESGGVWTEQTKLLASDGEADDRFGVSVSLSGDTALVGASGDDDNGSISGSVYVFVRSGNVWTEQTKLLASDGEANDRFGSAVSLTANGALIGAQTDDDNGNASGSAYVFVQSGGVWTEQTKLLPSDGDIEDSFGLSVSLSGDTALVGAPQDDDNGGDSGSAYVFVRSGSVWSEQTKLLASDGAILDRFGWSVSLTGDTALVGATANATQPVSGSAYVFVRSGSVWTEQAKLLPSDGAAGDVFGTSVSLSGDTALVGAPLHFDNGSVSGSAYFFGRSGNVWTEQAEFLPSDGETDDFFGWSVSLSGDTALVGANHDDDNGINSGSAYVLENFRLGASVTGMTLFPVFCQNFTTGQSGAAAAFGATFWSCNDLGVSASTGDRVLLRGAGIADGTGPVGGSVIGLGSAFLHRVTCKNLITAQTVRFKTADDSWDCEAAGLIVAPGNRVQQIVTGEV